MSSASRACIAFMHRCAIAEYLHNLFSTPGMLGALRIFRGAGACGWGCMACSLMGRWATGGACSPEAHIILTILELPPLPLYVFGRTSMVLVASHGGVDICSQTAFV